MIGVLMSMAIFMVLSFFSLLCDVIMDILTFIFNRIIECLCIVCCALKKNIEK